MALLERERERERETLLSLFISLSKFFIILSVGFPMFANINNAYLNYTISKITSATHRNNFHTPCGNMALTWRETWKDWEVLQINLLILRTVTLYGSRKDSLGAQRQIKQPLLQHRDHYMRALLARNRHPGSFKLDLVYSCNDMKSEVGIVEIVIFHLPLDEFA